MDNNTEAQQAEAVWESFEAFKNSFRKFSVDLQVGKDQAVEVLLTQLYERTGGYAPDNIEEQREFSAQSNELAWFASILLDIFTSIG